MTDPEKSTSLIEFCNKSFTSCNHKVVFHTALVLFNYLLAFEKVSKKDLKPILELSFKAADESLVN